MTLRDAPLDVAALRSVGDGVVVGRAFLYFEQVGSTNDVAREQARAGVPEGLVVLTEEQVRGRGRLGRGWEAPARSGLLLSLVLRPTWLLPTETFLLTMVAGVALCEAIEEVEPVQAWLKWPNDLVFAAGVEGERCVYRKAAGVLCELDFAEEQVVWAVVGMGVNVNWVPQGVVDGRDLGGSATSLSAVAGHGCDRMRLLRALLSRFDARYQALRGGRREELFAAWRDRLVFLGQPIEVRLPQGVVCGVAEGVEFSGALRVRDAAGVVHAVFAGDVGGYVS